MISFIESEFLQLSKTSGVPVDYLKLLSTFILSYPFAAILKRIPGRSAKSIFSICASLFYLVGLFSLWEGLVTFLINGAVTYLLAKYIKTSRMPWIAFGFLMAHLSFNHIKRQMINNEYVVDVTGAQMVLVMKLSGFCWNVHDERMRGLAQSSQASQDQKQVENLICETAQSKSTDNFPRFLDFAGYVMFFPALMAGPPFDYAEYDRFLDGTLFEGNKTEQQTKQTSVNSNLETKSSPKVPKTGLPATLRFLQGFGWLIAYLLMSSVFNRDLLLSKSFSVRMSLGQRLIVLYLYTVGFRCKYYSVWTLADGALIVTGIGYTQIEGCSGLKNWERLRNINPSKVEFARNLQECVRGWNVNTHRWLRTCMFARVRLIDIKMVELPNSSILPRNRSEGKAGSSTAIGTETRNEIEYAKSHRKIEKKRTSWWASLATFATSAVWHGFYPGYFFSFGMGFFLQLIGQGSRRQIRPRIDRSESKLVRVVYDVIFCFMGTQLTIAFAAVPFSILDFRESLQVWRELRWFGWWVVLGSLVVIEMFRRTGRKEA